MKRIAFILMFSALLPAAASAEQLGEIFDRHTPIVKAYQKVQDSVVNISGTQSYTSGGGLYDFFFSPRRQQRHTRKVELGSGVVVHSDGYIITNSHVVQGQEELHVTFYNGKEYTAEIISADIESDLAFLKIESDEDFDAIDFGTSSDLMIGETVIAVGNPLGFSSTVTEGIVSAIGRDIQVKQNFWLRGLIQTSAPINPGNSGGPLLNINGELIGINTAVSAGAQNIGFAIPIDTIANSLAKMLMPEELRRVRLGIVIGRMTTRDGLKGLNVEAVNEDTSASRQGIREGDIITEVEGKKVTSFLDFYVSIMDKEIGEDFHVKYHKSSEPADKEHHATLTLQPRPIPDGVKIAQKYFQMEVSPLDDDVAREFEFAQSYPVLIITDIAEKGVAEETGLQIGDIILQVNSHPVSSVKDFSLALEFLHEDDVVELRILRIGARGPYSYQRQYMVKMKAKIREDTKLNRKFKFEGKTI
ncbi:putative periplasmic serine endoprotease DegP-like precursor [Limihaloglobus sulfuriphilus]|uniref:Putative periplasmic serine endoprotease DegP-like n=1 Tax=Limihaloglobus sulfuriphilus TaxID=1851148 RepID=A0A1Q2ME36_9BACT|nr:trypsin-like peptidase domain-containing protein [Limihaloglobus sulfuriphilus]AQQ70904.1 putative periplasmic serine endoprotease DegP-like precursor [Limihaloglobus sulfuriphilus]